MWDNAFFFTKGMMNGLPWGQTRFDVPWLLENCFVERGTIRTRRGHAKVQDDDTTAILGVHYDSPNTDYYVSVTKDSIGQFGRFSGASFIAENIHDADLASVSGAVVTFTGTTDIRKRIGTDVDASAKDIVKFKYIKDAGGWTDWISVDSVDSATQITLVSSPGDATTKPYQLLIGTGNTTGQIVECGERYRVAIKGDPYPIVYDRIQDKAWIAGIPRPDPPTGSFAGSAAADAGWYSYVFVRVRLGVEESLSSPRLTKEATATNRFIDVSYTVPYLIGKLWIWTYNVYRTKKQSSEANANSASLYFLTTVNAATPVPGFVFTSPSTTIIQDTAYDANIDDTNEFTGSADSSLATPVGNFADQVDEEGGWLAYAVTYRLPSGEEGPISSRLIVQTGASAESIALTLPALMDFTDAVNIYRTELQDTSMDAGDAPLYYVKGWDNTSFTDQYAENTVNLLLPSPLETAQFQFADVALTGILYSGGHLYVWGEDNWVRKSGLPLGDGVVTGVDIGVGRGTGLDEPNYWPLMYEAGPSGKYVKCCVDYRAAIYAFKPNSVYVLDKTVPQDDQHYFAIVSQTVGCSYANCAAAGEHGMYTIFLDTDSKNKLVRVSSTGRTTVLNEIQATIDTATTFYWMKAAGQKIFISTDIGFIVFDEVRGTWNVDTGVTPTCMDVTNGVMYVGDATGKIYSLYTKAKGTVGDEGAYTWKVQSGAFDGGDRLSFSSWSQFWARWENTDASNAETVTVKVSSDGFVNYIQTVVPADWTQVITVPANKKDFIQEYPVLVNTDETLMGLELYGTGGYGDLALVGYGMEFAEPKTGAIGDT